MSMLQAKPSEKDYNAVLEFFQEIESWVEFGEAPEGEDADAFDLGDWIDSRWPHIDCCWRRVLFGGQVAIENACDPDKTHLAFKPEIELAMKAQKIMRETRMYVVPYGECKWVARMASGADVPGGYSHRDAEGGARDCPHKAVVDAHEWLENRVKDLIAETVGNKAKGEEK